jgi:hypothetical protein
MYFAEKKSKNEKMSSKAPPNDLGNPPIKKTKVKNSYAIWSIITQDSL